MQERGRLMLEEYLHIEREGQSGSPRLSPGTGLPISDRDSLDSAVGLLANFYFRSNRSDWVKSVCESLKEAGHNAATIDRNLARALGELGSEEAENAFNEAIDRHGDSLTHTFFSSYLNKQGREREAYEQSELAVINATNTARPTALYNLAADILNHGYARNADGEIASVDEDSALLLAIPVIAASVQYGDQSDREDAVGMLVRRNALVEAQAIAQGNQLPGDYNSAALDYILKRINESGRTKI